LDFLVFVTEYMEKPREAKGKRMAALILRAGGQDTV
jgi:hypothetical protein